MCSSCRHGAAVDVVGASRTQAGECPGTADERLRGRAQSLDAGDSARPLPRHRQRRSVAESERCRSFVYVDSRHRIANLAARRSLQIGQQPRRPAQVAVADAAVAVEIQSILERQRLLPRQMPGQPHQVEDVERIAGHIQIAQVIMADDEQQRIGGASGRRGRVSRHAAGGRPRIEEIGERRGRFERRQGNGDIAVCIRDRRELVRGGIAVGPVRQPDACGREAGTRLDVSRDDHRQVLDAGIVDRRILESGARIVEPVVAVWSHLQAAVPELDRTVRAGRHEEAAPPVVADHPWSTRRHERRDEHEQVADLSRCPSPEDQVACRREEREEDEVGPELKRSGRQQPACRKPQSPIARSAQRKREDRSDEQHRAQRIGRLCGHIDRVERKKSDEHRAHNRDFLAHLEPDEGVDHQRYRRVGQRLDAQRYPLTIAGQPVPAGEKIRVAPHPLHRRKRVTTDEGLRELVVEVDAVPAPWQRRPDEDEEQAECKADAARRIHGGAAARGEIESRGHPGGIIPVKGSLKRALDHVRHLR